MLIFLHFSDISRLGLGSALKFRSDCDRVQGVVVDCRKLLDFDHTGRPASKLSQARTIFPLSHIYSRRTSARVMGIGNRLRRNRPPQTPQTKCELVAESQKLIDITWLHKKHPVTILYYMLRCYPTPIYDHPEAANPVAALVPPESGSSISCPWLLVLCGPCHIPTLVMTRRYRRSAYYTRTFN